MKKFIVFIFILLMSVNFSLGYYADIVVFVDEAGYTSIDGLTNHPLLLVLDSSNFTSKKGNLWTLNISQNELFSDLAYEINLPKGAIVNYLKVPAFGRIEENGNLVISGAAQNTTLNFLVQYKINKPSSISFPWWIVILLGMFLSSWFVGFKLIKKRAVFSSLDLTKFSLRQKTIISFIIKSGGEITQVKLERLTGFPKSSLSRNIDSLVRKGVIEKFNTGMTNTLRLQKFKKVNKYKN